MSKLFNLLFTLLALTLSSPTKASPAPDINDPDLSPISYSPSPSYGGDSLSPEPQYPNGEEGDLSPIYPPSPLAYSPNIDEEYPYAQNPSPSHSPLAYAPSIDEEYPYADNPTSPSPSPSYFDILAPEAEDDNNNDGFYSPNQAPSPTESSIYSDVMAPQVDAIASPPVLPFNYSAEDDAGDQIISDSYQLDELNKKNNRAVIGLVMGAICLVGLGAFVYKKQKNQKRDHPMYVQLSKKDSDV